MKHQFMIDLNNILITPVTKRSQSFFRRGAASKSVDDTGLERFRDEKNVQLIR